MLDKDILGQALYNARLDFMNKTHDQLVTIYGTIEDARLAACKADAQVIIDHIKNYAKLTVPGTGLTAPNGPVGGQSITGNIT